MKVLKSEKFIEDTVLLVEGEDYQKSDLQGNPFVGGRLKELSPNTLLEIAKSKGYDRWSWMGHEHEGTIEVKLRNPVFSAEKVSGLIVKLEFLLFEFGDSRFFCEVRCKFKLCEEFFGGIVKALF